jgi:hypothetical protein
MAMCTVTVGVACSGGARTRLLAESSSPSTTVDPQTQRLCDTLVSVANGGAKTSIIAAYSITASDARGLLVKLQEQISPDVEAVLAAAPPAAVCWQYAPDGYSTPTVSYDLAVVLVTDGGSHDLWFANRTQVVLTSPQAELAGQSHDAQTVHAEHVCQKAVPGYATASATTVRDVHAFDGGPPGSKVGAGSFPGAPDNEFAAWCWRWNATGDGHPPGFAVFAVDEAGASREFVLNVPGDPDHPQSGPPPIP